MRYAAEEIRELLEALEIKERNQYVDKIKKYRKECGCSMGGLFVIISLAGYVAYTWSVFHEVSLFSAAKIIFTGIVIVFVAGLVGKITGIYLAKIKLLLLYRSLRSNLHKKTIRYADMYKMGKHN